MLTIIARISEDSLHYLGETAYSKALALMDSGWDLATFIIVSPGSIDRELEGVSVSRLS